MRTVRIHFSNTFIADNDIPSKVYFAAMGYLSWWSSSKYPTVDVYDDKGGDMVAVFTADNGIDKYTIGAIYDPLAQKYSFHS